MITSKGIVLLNQDALIAYNSPTITVIGQQSNLSNAGTVDLSLEIKRTDGSSLVNTSISLTTDSVKTASEANNINGSGLIDNLYNLLEQLLKLQLEEINPNTIFELQ